MLDFIGDLIRAPFICFGWIIVGFIAGAMGRYLMRSEDRLFINDIILGLAGAAVAGFITSGLLGFDPNASGLELVLINLVLATGGAMGLIYIGRVVFGNSKKGGRKRKR
ncbi:MAG: hypothetical protein CUN56_12100 [Phototrophicales bacterium]|nr:MAG: hypothetical protein CUN56_12100 [Phototrophicales bacterium]RMG70177.1 MAG: GlsB/YeaQ/YmgE family stress response membrane protein [Chloroflexota bacterium]